MPTPDRILQTLSGYMMSAALKAAIELDVFSAIAQSIDGAEALARHCNATERGMRILCDYLTVAAFLTKEGERYGLSPESAMFLDRRSPAYLGSVAFFLGSDHLKGEFRDVAQLVREGGALDHGKSLEPNHHMWVDFAHSMAPMMKLPAHLMSEILLQASNEPMKILDIAAGHGMFGITFALKNPNARIVAVDWPVVVALAQRNAEERGVAERYQTVPGSAFEVDFGGDYDLVLLPNFLHHFEPRKIEELLVKVRGSLRPGGRVATVEFVPNDDRVTPPFPAAFSMMMLGGTPSGDAYTFEELRQMFANAGFSSIVRHDLVPTPSTLLISSV